MKVVSIKEMQDIERDADASGHSFGEMMERAGRAVTTVAMQMLDDRGSPSVVVLVGPGNNGGDGLVAARHLAEAGMKIRAWCYHRKLKGGKMAALAKQAGVEIIAEDEDPERTTLREWLDESDLLMDALLGTGAARPIKGKMKSMLTAMREVLDERRQQRSACTTDGLVDLTSFPLEEAEGTHHPAPWPQVLAVDCPSGLNCDTGALDPAALHADITVTFAYPKRGHFLPPGADALGCLIVADIGVPPHLADAVEVEVATPEMVHPWLPDRSALSHKGTFGKAMIVAGSTNYTGAAYLAGAAAARAGAGLVTMAVAAPLHNSLAAILHEATWLLLPHDLGAIAPSAANLVREQMSDYQALLVGCGLSTEKPTAKFLESLLINREQGAARTWFKSHREADEDAEADNSEHPTLPPLVIDADGLNLLARLSGWPLRLSGWPQHLHGWPLRMPTPAILTPHPGEMARLCGCETEEVQEDRLNMARQKAETWGHIVVLKGPHTICASPDGRTVIQPFANPALATAGTGDVLAGTVVGLLAQGVPAFEAAVLGCYLHGLAGEMMRREIGIAGGLAGDLLPRLPRAMSMLRGTHPPVPRKAA